MLLNILTTDNFTVKESAATMETEFDFIIYIAIVYILPLVIMLLIFFAIMKIYKIHNLLQAQHIIAREQNEKLAIQINIQQEEIRLLKQLINSTTMTAQAPNNQVRTTPGTNPDFSE